MVSVSEQLTAQFYEWERKGRGWRAFKEPVDLEPHFHPFFFHRVKPQTNIIDDGKRHTLFSWIGEAIIGKPKEEPVEDPYAWMDGDGTEAHLFECDEPLVAYSLHLPKGARIDVQATEQLLFMLSGTLYPLAFEIYGSGKSISFQICCRASDAVQVQSQIKAYFPECIVKEQKDRMDAVLENEKGYAYIRYYALKDEFMRPLKMAGSFKPDPLTGLLASLEHLEDSDHAVIQILFKGAVNPWAESILRSVTDSEGKSFFENAPEMVPLAREKVSSPLFGVCMRVMGASTSLDRAEYISGLAGSALGRIYFSESNSLIPIQSPLPFETNLDDIIFRETHILGMLLNARELATVVHLPSETVASEKLERDTRKTKAPPAITEGHELILGTNEHQGRTKLVTVNSNTRMRHTHIIGATGTGKSTFILSLIAQDIQNGKGFAVLDPHGDLIESILAYIPAERANDVVLIDPADADYPVGFNILQAHSEIEKDILSSDLVAVFKRLSTSWGDQMNSVFANAILAILESTDGGTLVDLRRFLVEPAYRSNYLKTVSDPNIVYYWQKEYPILKSNSIGPILTRLDTFLRPKLIRNMVAQKKGLDFENILDTGKILLVKLSQGLIGTENSYLLGTFFVTKMYQAAMARQIKAQTSRQDFFLYIDEFQNFITPSMSQILSGARKYHLGLILAHQDMQQLQKYDSELASAVVANAGTRICFRLGDTDAKRFESGFAYFEAKDLENLHTGEAIARVERSEYDFSLTTIPPKHIDEALAEQRKSDVIQKSREAHGAQRQEVEATLESLRGNLLEEEPKKEPIITPTPKTTAPIDASLKDAVKTDRTPVNPSLENEVKKKEENQHRYLQALIKKMSESRGYATRIEEPTPDGKGRVDVHLERNGKRIAVEICNTTEAEWEVHNIQKCFAAGYDQIICCSDEKKSLNAIQKKTNAILSGDAGNRLQFLQPEQFFEFLDQELAKEASTEKRIRGYRVKVNYSAVTPDEAKDLSDSIVKTVTDATRKKPKK